MKKYKTFINFCLVLCVCLSLFTPAMAVENEDSVDSVEVIEVHFIDIPEDIPESDIPAYIDELNEESQAIIIAGKIDIYAWRKYVGDGTLCDIAIHWAGSPASACRFKKITIDSGSFLWPEVYATFGDGVTYTQVTFSLQTDCTVYIGQANIPTDVDTVYAVMTDGQIYATQVADWVSIDTNRDKVDIK